MSQNQEDRKNVYFLKILFKINIKIDFWIGAVVTFC